MLAVRLERDVTEHDHLVVTADFFEGAAEVVRRIDGVAGKPVRIRVDHAFGGVEQTFALRVIAGPAQQRTNRRFGFVAGYLRWSGCGFLLGCHARDSSLEVRVEELDRAAPRELRSR